jgi:hypothetical protein
LTAFCEEKANMSIKNLFSGAIFVGEAAGDRQTYFVFSVDAGYIVVARRSRNNFSITLVERDAPQVIARKFKGQRITVKDLKSRGGRADLFGEYFDRLNALYVMVATGRAKKLKEKLGRAMLFKVK